MYSSRRIAQPLCSSRNCSRYANVFLAKGYLVHVAPPSLVRNTAAGANPLAVHVPDSYCPETQPVAGSRKSTAASPRMPRGRCRVQVAPPSLVCCRARPPLGDSAIAQPFASSTNSTPVSSPDTSALCSVQVAPPSAVCRIRGRDSRPAVAPTIQPCSASGKLRSLRVCDQRRGAASSSQRTPSPLCTTAPTRSTAQTPVAETASAAVKR